MNSSRDYLALDFGATSGRAILGRFRGRRLVLEEVHRFPNGPIERNGHLYWDVPALFEEVGTALRKASNASHSLVSVGCDTWGQDHGFIDRDGTLLDLPYCYRDARTEGLLDTIEQIVPRSELLRRTAAPCTHISTLCQILATRTTNPGLIDRADTVLFTSGLVHHYLTGKRTAEFCMASLSQLLSWERLEWDDGLIERFSLPRRLFPDVLQPMREIGPVRRSLIRDLGIPPTTVHLPACHDTASAAVGAGLTSMDDLLLSSGTWSMLAVATDRPVTSLEAMDAGCGNIGIPGPDWALTCGIMGLWYLDRLREEELNIPAAELVRLAGEWAGEPCFFDPGDVRFQGRESFRSILTEWCRHTGQRTPETPVECARCILESLALYYDRAVRTVERLTRRRIKRILLVGGGSRNELLNQMTANATGLPVATGVSEMTAVGNVLCQMVGTGDLSSLEEAQAVSAASFASRTYEPTQWDIWAAKKGRFASLTDTTRQHD